MQPRTSVRIAAIGDLHCTRTAEGVLHAIFSALPAEADILVLCGDLTDYGTEEEAHLLAKELHALKIPIVGVLGNHDYESDQQDLVKKILTDAGVAVLDGTAHVIGSVGFAGVKGFCGGFGRRGLTPFGERGIKRFVHEAMAETEKFESALSRLRTPVRVAVTHYAPIQATVEGEPLEIYPFLGSSRLEDPIDRYRATVCVHGHAHRGAPHGATRGNVPVHNVALPLMRRLYGEANVFQLFELPLREVDATNTAAPLPP